MRYLVLPGLYGSGPGHWQSRWEAAYGYERVEQAEWDAPVLADWMGRLESRIDRSGGGNALVAHSLGCILAAHSMARIAAFASVLFFVAPPDPESLPSLAPSFADPPLRPLGVPGLLVYGDDDPYCPASRSRELAAAWGLEPVGLGRKGHINADSGLGDWGAGQELLRDLVLRSAGGL